MSQVKLHIALAVLSAMVISTAAQAATETEDFTTAPGAAAHGWTAVVTPNSTINYSPTNFAGGAIGEGGGSSRRSTDTGYYADTSLGTMNFGTENLIASANFAVNNNTGFSGINLVGFFDQTKTSGPQANWVGLLLTDNNASTYRVAPLIAHDPALSASGEDNFDLGPLQQLTFNTVYTLELSTDGKNLTTRVLQGGSQIYTATVTSTSQNTVAEAFDVNAFGLIAGGSSSPGGTTWDSYIDNVTYSTAVPEPAAISLLAGGAVVGLARRRRAVRA
jgi:hypothetical protein